MALSRQHLTGFAIGIGAAGLGFFLYKRYQGKVDDFLRKQGINIPKLGSKEYSSMTLEELVTEKERLEDIIAEVEHASASTQKTGTKQKKAQAET
jgi:hypothetical protein